MLRIISRHRCTVRVRHCGGCSGRAGRQRNTPPTTFADAGRDLQGQRALGRSDPLARDLNGKETALVICDMWDKHWCEKATGRCGVLAKKIAAVLPMARAAQEHHRRSCLPSEYAWIFYKDYELAAAAKRLADVKRVSMPELLKLNDPPLPIDDSDGGCDDEKPVKFFKAWTRQHGAPSP